jgi:hypothetical protein
LTEDDDLAGRMMSEPTVNTVLRSQTLLDNLIEPMDFRVCLRGASKIAIHTGTYQQIKSLQIAGRAMVIVVMESEKVINVLRERFDHVFAVKPSSQGFALPQVVVLEVLEERNLDEDLVRIGIKLPRWVKIRLEEIKSDLCVGYSEVIRLALGQAGFLERS